MYRRGKAREELIHLFLVESRCLSWSNKTKYTLSPSVSHPVFPFPSILADSRHCCGAEDKNARGCVRMKHASYDEDE